MFGQRFKLKTRTIAVSLEGGKKIAVAVPMDAEIVVTDKVPVDHTDRNRQVTVEWAGKIVTMFAVDIRDRGERVVERKRPV
jgi:hypothetical protein